MAGEIQQGQTDLMKFAQRLEDERRERAAAFKNKPPAKPESTLTTHPLTTTNFQPPRGRQRSVVPLQGTVPLPNTFAGPFCGIGASVADPDDYFITGGPINIGDKNYNVPDLLVGTTAGSYLIEVRAPLTELNRTDDHNYYLSGVKTCTTPTLVMHAVLESAGYTPNVNPPVASGIGTIVFMVGSVKVPATGLPMFAPTACGGFRAEQCGGILSYVRV